jgi:hypothetical protein
MHRLLLAEGSHTYSPGQPSARGQCWSSRRARSPHQPGTAGQRLHADTGFAGQEVADLSDDSRWYWHSVPGRMQHSEGPGAHSAEARASQKLRNAPQVAKSEPDRKATHRESSASESSSERIRVTDSWSPVAGDSWMRSSRFRITAASWSVVPTARLRRLFFSCNGGTSHGALDSGRRGRCQAGERRASVALVCGSGG